MLQSFCWSQGCWWQGLSQAALTALLGSGSCLQVLSRPLLSSSFDFRGKWCTIMAANICFTKIRLWSKFSPRCTIVKGWFQLQQLSPSWWTDQLHTFTFPRTLLRPVEMQSVRSHLNPWPGAISEDWQPKRRRWPCDTAGLQSPLSHVSHRGNTCSPTSWVSLAPVKQTKAFSQPVQLHFSRAHTRACKSEVFTSFSEPPTQFPYALIYTSLKASFWPQLNNLSQKDCKLPEKVLVIIIFLHLYSITSVLKAFSYSASGDKKLKCLCSQVH